MKKIIIILSIILLYNCKESIVIPEVPEVPEVSLPTKALVKLITPSLKLATTTSINIAYGISNNGGSEIIENGICWNTESNPTILNNKIIDKTNIYNHTIVDLKQNTSYFVRAYAINSVGINYSDEKIFTTLNLKEYLLPSYNLRLTDLWLDYYNIPKSNGLNTNYYAYDCPNVIADFNGDGYDDVLMAPMSYIKLNKRQPIELYDFQNFILDKTLIKQNIGTINARKGIVGDFNNDGKPDVVYADFGVDSPPFDGAEQTIVISSSNGYIQKFISNKKWSAHGVCSGDIDNDGDLDIYFTGNSINHFLFINDGNGNFVNHIEKIKFDENGAYTCEMRDINKDGYIDLIVGGSDDNQASRILWGNGQDFKDSNSVILPTVKGWGLSLDFNFYDIDKDKQDEIIINRTQDNSNGHNYEGYRIQILKNIGNYLYKDITEEIIENYVDITVKWIVWLRVQDIDKNGKLDIFDSDKGHYDTGKSIRWEEDINGIFKKIK